MTVRPWLFWPHLIAGVLAGAVILLMSVTGVLLTYERQLIAWSDSHFHSAPPETGAEPLPVEQLLARVRASRPDLAPTAITIGSAADAPVMLSVPPKTFYADAYTGAVLGEGTQGMRTFMSELRAWHRWIAIDGPGRTLARAITGWANLLFLFVVLSGMYLWLPRRWPWPNVRAVLLFKRGTAGKARDFNWHNVIGIWSAVPLAIVVASAVPISFPWGNALVYRMVGEEAPPPGGRGVRPGAGARGGGPGGGERGEAWREQRPAPLDGLDVLMARAERQVAGWRTINMRIPNGASAPVVFAIDKGDGGQPQYRSTLTLDRSTGDVISYEAFSDLTLGRRIRNVMRFAHTGEVLGIPGQTVAGLVTLGSVVLIWTGIALALRRFRNWLRRGRTHSLETVEAGETAA